MANIFRGFSRLSAATEEKLKAAPKDSDEEAILWETKDLLDDILNYMTSFEWMTYQSAKEKLNVYFNSGYDLNAICDEFGVSYKSAKDCVYWAARKFRKKVGDNTLSLLKEGLIDEARAAYYVSSGKIDVKNLIVDEFQQYLPSSKFGTYELADCQKELQIIRNVSKFYMLKMSKIMDKEKMSYLLYLLTGHSKKSEMYRPYLLAMLQNGYSINDLLEADEYIKEQLKKA